MEQRAQTYLLWASNLQHFVNVEVRPGSLAPSLTSSKILGDTFMFSSRSRKSLLGALLLAGLLPWAATGQAQDSGRKVLKKVIAQYPAILKSKGIGGVVRLKVFIKPDGSVRDTEVIGGNPILAESAQKAVLQWKFTPASSETNIEVSVVFDPHSEN